MKKLQKMNFLHGVAARNWNQQKVKGNNTLENSQIWFQNLDNCTGAC